MASPVPKHPSQRRNTSPKLGGEWVEMHVRTLAKPVLPTLAKMGKREGGAVWSAAAKRRWEAWRRDPVSSYWGEADVECAIDLLELYECGLVENAAEIRQRGDRLALNPQAKRNQRFRVLWVEANIASEARKDRPPPPEPENVTAIDSRRQNLSA